jgi:hypothetical protein
MRIGKKAQGQDHLAKMCAQRHVKCKAPAKRIEKAAETRVRQAGKREIRAELAY